MSLFVAHRWNLPTNVSHKRKVLSLYKVALKNLESWYVYRDVYRYHAVLLRQRFEDNKKVDKETGECLLLSGLEELRSQQHYSLKIFPESVGGVAYEREVIPPDWVVDYWDPLEKAQYPEYFARREQRKKEFLSKWEKEHSSENYPKF